MKNDLKNSKKYEKPVLTVHGDFRNITNATGGLGGDGGNFAPPSGG